VKTAGDEGSDYGSVSRPPIEEFLDALDRLELDAIMALMTTDVRVLWSTAVARKGPMPSGSCSLTSSASFARPNPGSRPSGTRTTLDRRSRRQL